MIACLRFPRFRKQNHTRDEGQGQFHVEDKHATTSHEISQGHGQGKDSEQPPQKVNPSPVLLNAEHPHRKQEEPESSMAREGQQTTDDRIEQENPNTTCRVPQNAELTEGHQGPLFQAQKEADAPNTQDKTIVPDTTQSQRYDTDLIGARQQRRSHSHDTNSNGTHRRRRSHSQSAGIPLDGIREPLPKKGGLGKWILGKESREEKQRKDGAYLQKRSPSQPPNSYPTQSRSDKPQSRPETPQARSELPLVRRDSSKSTSGIPPKNSDPLRPGGGRDPGLTRGQVPPPAVKTVDPHAWERHLPQSADDATIQHKVLTLFEFIEHHVDGYYRDSYAKISQPPVQLAKLQSRYLPHGIPIEDLLVQARYQGPVIKHCLINLVVSGMTTDESPLFSLLPEEFTTLPRAIRKNRDEIEKRPYQDQALSKFRSLCIHLRPNIREDPDYTRKLDEIITQAVALCLAAFAPWARGQDSENRYQHLVNLFKMAADVGVLLFSQPSCLIFDWKSPERRGSASDILVWPRLLRTTNPNVEVLPTPQVIVESLSQSIGIEVARLRRFQGNTRIYELSSVNAQENTSERLTHGDYSVPSELATPERSVSATLPGPQNGPYVSPPKQIDQRTQYSDYRAVHSVAIAPQHKALDQDAGNLDIQGRSIALPRRPVGTSPRR